MLLNLIMKLRLYRILSMHVSGSSSNRQILLHCLVFIVTLTLTPTRMNPQRHQLQENWYMIMPTLFTNSFRLIKLLNYSARTIHHCTSLNKIYRSQDGFFRQHFITLINFMTFTHIEWLSNAIKREKEYYCYAKIVIELRRPHMKWDTSKGMMMMCCLGGFGA